MDTALYFASWTEALRSSVQTITFRIVNGLPLIIGAIIVFLIGYLIAKALEKIVVKVIEYSRVRSFFNHTGIHQEAAKMGVSGTIADWAGAAVKWFVILLTLLTVSDILHIEQLTSFINQVVLYIPRVVIAIIILGVGFIGGRLLHDIVERAAASSEMLRDSAGTLAAMAKWAVIIFALMAALIQLGIAASLIQILFTGLVAMVAIAGGIAFGLGGSDRAKRTINNMTQELK